MDVTAARNKALVRAHHEATVNGFDPAAIGEQAAEDFRDHAAGARLGPGGVALHVAGLRSAFPDLRVTIDDILAEDDRVAVRATWRGTHLGGFRGVPASGRRVEFSGTEIWRVEAGKLRERWASADVLGALTAAAEG